MKKYPYTEKKDTRSGFGAGLVELGKKNPNVVALCADLTGSLKMDAFEKAPPTKASSKPSIPDLVELLRLVSWLGSIPGRTMCEPTR